MPDVIERPLLSFSALRQIAETSAITHACIELTCNEVRCADWDVLTHGALADLPRPYRKLSGERRSEAVRFFRHPDANYAGVTTWLHALAREILVTDSLAVYVTPNRGATGLLGSNIGGLEILDGALIVPGDHLVAQAAGEVRRARAADVPPAGGPLSSPAGGPWARTFGSRELLYRPMRAPEGEAFGRSPIEDAIAYTEDGSIDMAATEAAMPAAFGIDLARLGMPGRDGARAARFAAQVRAHLKGIFDFVLHDLCEAPDLEWHWKGDHA